MKAIVFIIGLLSSSIVFHDVAVAVFTVYESAGTLQLKTVIDREDLSTELAILESEITVKTLQEYLEAHCSFLINNVPVVIEVNQIKNDEDHIVVQSVLKGAFKSYNNIEINNTCLNTISNHSNIIRVKLNDTQRDFRMHKGRKKIELSY